MIQHKAVIENGSCFSYKSKSPGVLSASFLGRLYHFRALLPLEEWSDDLLWQLLWNNVLGFPPHFFFYIFNCLFCLKYLCNLFFCVCVTSNVTRICAFLILYYMKKTHGLLLSNVSLLDTVQWTRNMCSCLYICSSSWASRNKKSNHCVCRKHLPRGNFIPVWKDSLLLFRLLHCSVACSKGKISQVSLSWSNSVTREDRLHLK